MIEVLGLVHHAFPQGPREALEYDLYYIKHRSPALDACIVLHSLMEVPFREG